MRNRIFIGLLILVCLLFSQTTAFAELDIGGYLQSELDYVNYKDAARLAAQSKARLRIAKDVCDYLYLHTELKYDRLDGSSIISLPDYNSLDRCYAKIYLPFADMTIGRQRVSWGTAYAWNPTDVFYTFSLTTVDEERTGMNAARIIIPLGVASNLELVQTSEQNTSQDKFAVKAKTNIVIFDLSTSYIKLNSAGDYQIGGDFSGEMYEVGLRGEFANVYPKSSGEYSKSVLGIDYTFESGWGIASEYSFNGLGNSATANYDWTSYLAGSITQMARNYTYVSLTKDFWDLHYLTFVTIYNLDDGSHVYYPMWQYNMMDDLDLYFGVLVVGGNSGTEYNPTSAQDPTGLLGNGYYFVKIRWSF